MLHSFSAQILRAVAPYETPAPAMLGKLPSMILYTVLPYEMAPHERKWLEFLPQGGEKHRFFEEVPGTH